MESRGLSGQRPEATAPSAAFSAPTSWAISSRANASPAVASPDGQGGVPNITQFKLKNWTVADIADTLDTGMTPDADALLAAA